MPWVCLKCGYKTKEYEGQECPDCKGLMEECDPEIEWEGEDKEEEKNRSSDENQTDEDQDQDNKEENNLAL